MFGRKSKFEIKTPDQFLLMRKAGLVVADVLARMQVEAVPGVTTEQLDRIAREMLKAAGAESSFLGYFGYPSVICASVNEEVVHAIPNPRTLQDGDILSVDFGAIVEGWNGDAAVTIEIGTAIEKQTALSKTTELSMEPMATLGSRHVRTLEDDWTVVTTDGSRAAHWEHTVAITEEGPWVLTAHDGGAAFFRAHRIPSPAAKYAV